MTEAHIRDLLNQNGIFAGKNKLILGVSGGIDSMVLSAVFNKLGFEFIIAHVNYGLRGADSLKDEEFVRDWAGKINKPFESLNASTQVQNKSSGESIQMVARKIRFAWWNHLLNVHGYDYIVTGHQADDNIETFFINLLRGSGGRGLSGMEIINDNLLHPFLNFSRKEITHYAEKHKIPWRDDASNEEEKYLRNRIRLTILPAFRKIDSQFEDHLKDTFQRIKEEKKLLDFLIIKEKSGNISQSQNQITIPKFFLKNFPNPGYFLFELLRDKGFSYSVCQNIEKVLNSTESLHFQTEEWILENERGHLKISKKKPIEKKTKLDISQFEFYTIKDLPSRESMSQSEAYIDMETIPYPLELRTWRTGDYFFPTGMDGKKKISDFYTDLKYTKEQKKQQLLITHQDEIVWIVNQRVDRRFAATPHSKNILRLRYSG